MSWILLPPLAVLAVAFAIANRHGVMVRLDPLPFEKVLPLYLLIYGGILVGLLAGGLASWLRGGAWRGEARQQRRRAVRAEKEIAQSAAAEPVAQTAAVPRIENAA